MQKSIKMMNAYMNNKNGISELKNIHEHENMAAREQ